MMKNVVKAVVTTARAADSMMMSVRAVVLMMTNRVNAVSTMTTVHVADLMMKTDHVAVSMMTNLAENAVSTTVLAADLMMMSVHAVASMTTSRVSAVSKMMIDRVVGLMTTVRDVVLRMMTDRVADSMMTVRVVATAALMTVPVVDSRMKKSRVVAVRVMFARKTRCTTARKPLAKSA